MAGKVCPILSAGAESAQLRQCIGEECMLFMSSQATGGCALVKAPTQIFSRMDTLTAQLQEMQVALIKLTNA